MTTQPHTSAAEAKKSQMRSMFNRIAPSYDLLNHLLSLNIDRLWRRHVVQIVRRKSPAVILDAATGTGDLAIDLARRMPQVQIRGIDLSEEMLAVARQKIAARGLETRIRLAVDDAERLSLDDAAADAVTVGFGVRNFGNIDAGLREFFRVLKPGGQLVVLELSRPRNRVFRWIFESYFHKLLPRIGGLISRERKAYEYLPASVKAFPAPEKFLDQMRQAGFSDCRSKSQSFGIAQIYIGEKEV